MLNQAYDSHIPITSQSGDLTLSPPVGCVVGYSVLLHEKLRKSYFI